MGEFYEDHGHRIRPFFSRFAALGFKTQGGGELASFRFFQFLLVFVWEKGPLKEHAFAKYADFVWGYQVTLGHAAS